MAADALAAYEQDMQDVAVSPMDAAAMLTDAVSQFPSTLVAQPPSMFSSLLQADPLFMVKAEQPDDLVSPMHMLPEDPSLAYMNVPMDESSASLDSLVYPPDIASGAPSFTLAPPTDATMSLEIPQTALSTPSPPLPGMATSQPLAVSGLSLELSPASISANSPPFSVVPSSLEAALIPTAPFTSPPRASNSVSPVPISNASSQSPASIPTPYSTSASQSPTATSAASQSAIVLLPPAEAENILIKDEVPMAKQKKEVANLLNALANDFMVASQAVHRLEASSGELPDELKNRISNLSRMAAQLSISSGSDSSPPPHSPTPPPSSVPSVSLVPVASPSIPPHLVPSETSANYSIHDHTLKRGPCDLDEHRSVKAMKREPQDFSLPLMAEALPLDPSAVFPATTAIPSSHAIPQSRPVSRPPSPSPTNFAAAVAQYNMIPPTIFHPCPPGPSAPTMAPMANSLPPSVPAMSLTGPPGFPGGRASWSEPSVVQQSRHHHSLSAGAILSPIQAMPPTPNMQMPQTLGGHPAIASGPNTPVSVLPPPHVRTARSGSLSSLPFDATSYFSFPEKVSEVPISPLGHPGARNARSSMIGSTTTNWYFGGNDSSSPTNTSEEPGTTRNSPSDDEDDDDGNSSSDEEDDVNPASKSTTHLPSAEGSSSSSPSVASDIPNEYRQEVDRIFFEYLNKICSNLEAKDSKGDHIHQTLMAKKMQRLDESPDFRPFKFRIQAFTTAFLEELARQGYTEDKIPMKKVRNYLWHQPHILRFNEDGKKAKSKGNHIWNVEARKLGDGRWEFRPFHRKLAGTPAAVAYVGLKWSWTPRVWDPQASFQNVPVQYSSPNLPGWLSWKEDTLAGVPPPGAESCHITVIAKYIHDGVEGQLTRQFPIAIAPVGSSEAGQYPRSRRPSAAAASEAPRRSTSDSALCQAPARAKPRGVPVPIPNENASTRVIRVLQNVAQRVTEEAEHQLAPSMSMSMVPKTDSLQEIVKQKHVLDQTVEAFDKEMSGQSGMASKRLAIAAQQVVIQAAANVIADRNVSIGRAPVVPNKSTAVQRVSVGELTDATHDAIAAAVKNNGTGSTEVDIIVAAASILKAKAPSAESGPPAGIPSTRTIPSMNFASNLSTLPEMM